MSGGGRVRRSSLLDAVAAVAAGGGNMLLLAVAGIVLARALGPEGKGVVTLVAVLGTRAVLMLSLGVDSALVHFGGRERWPVRTLARSAQALGLLLGLLASGVTVALLWTVFRDDVGASTLAWAVPAIALLPVVSVRTFLWSLAQVQGRIVETNVVLAGGGLLLLVTAVVVLVFGWGPGPYLAAFAVAGLLEALAVITVARRAGVLPAGSLDSSTLRPLLGYGLRGHLGTVFQGVNDRFDVVVLALFVPIELVGIYTAATAAAEALGFVSNALGQVVLQRSAFHDTQAAARLTGAACRLTSAAIALGAAVLALVAEPAVRVVFGADFAGATTPLRLLLPGIWALGLWRILTQSLVGYGRAGAKSVSAGAAAVLTVVLDLALIPRYGISGAASASSVAYTVAFLIAAVIARREYGADLGNILVPRRRDLNLLASAARNLVPRLSTSRPPQDPNDPVAP